MIYRDLTEQETSYLEANKDMFKTAYKYYVLRGGRRAFKLWLKEEVVRIYGEMTSTVDTSDAALDGIIDEFIGE